MKKEILPTRFVADFHQKLNATGNESARSVMILFSKLRIISNLMKTASNEAYFFIFYYFFI